MEHYPITRSHFLVICIAALGIVADSKDTETYACYSSVVGCGQHKLACPKGEVVIITDAKYAHLSRTTSCSRGKISSCTPRYVRACCRPSGNECYGSYVEDDGIDLLRPCLGSKSCTHMTPQTKRKCGTNKLSTSIFAAVTHRCVPSKHIISYDTEESVTNTDVYLFYETTKSEADVGTARVYGCDVNGPAGSKVKVNALDVGMAKTDDGACSSLEIGKSAEFSCDKSDLRFLKMLYEGTVPFEVNIADVGGNSPEAAWVQIEAAGNITVECGKVRETRKVKSNSQTTNAGEVISQPTTAASLLTKPTTTSTASTTQTPSTERTTTTDSTSQTTESTTIGSNAEGDTNTDTTADIEDVAPVNDGNSDTPQDSSESTRLLPTESAVLLPAASQHDRVLTYGGIAGGLLLLIILIIIITIICYRRKRCRRYQSRKMEEERNIPDGEERRTDHPDEMRETGGNEIQSPDGKGVNSDSKGDNSLPKRVKGRREKGFSTLPMSLTSTPRVSQPRDSDGYTNAGKPYGDEEPRRDATIEFYDNPGFKTTLQNIKLPG